MTEIASIAVPAENPRQTAPYFAVSPAKLVVMSLCTLGFYDIYWFYSHWRLVKERERANILPPLRAVFAYFFCYSLFSRIRSSAQASKVEVLLPAGPIAAAWIVISLLWKLPGPYWLVSFLAPFLLIPAQIAANRINETVAPGHDRNARFSGTNIVTMVVGGFLLVLAVLGTFIPA